jgi:hypothetical protein
MRTLLTVIVVIISIWALITGTNTFSPYMLLFVGAMILFIGLSEIKAKRKTNAIISFIASGFVFSVSAYILLN